MKLTRYTLAAAAFFIVHTGAACGPFYDIMTKPPPTEGVSLPIKSDLFLGVEGTINGKPANILLDTGTVLFSLVPPSAIEEFGLTPAGDNPYAAEELDGVGVCGSVGADASLSAKLYTAARIEIGGVVVENAAFVVLEEENFNTFDAVRVNCIMNGSLLAQVDWKIDQYGRRLTLFPSRSLSRPGEPAELNLLGPIPPLFLLLQGAPKIGGISTRLRYADPNAEPVETLMDTGGGIELAIGENVLANTGWNIDELPNTRAGLFAAGGSCAATRFRAPLVGLAEQTYEHVQAVTLPAADVGLIGWRFFANHEEVNVSPKAGWIEFRKGADTDSYFAAPLMTFGVDLAVKSDNTYRIAKVAAGSDAEAAGVRVGDIVRAVNGVSVDTLEGKSLLFGPRVMRDGVVTYTLEDDEGSIRDVELTGTPVL